MTIITDKGFHILCYVLWAAVYQQTKITLEPKCVETSRFINFEFDKLFTTPYYPTYSNTD